MPRNQLRPAGCDTENNQDLGAFAGKGARGAKLEFSLQGGAREAPRVEALCVFLNTRDRPILSALLAEVRVGGTRERQQLPPTGGTKGAVPEN
jgi:hypothetical protein